MPISTTTIVLKRDGRHHATVEGMSPEDAHRWAAEGYHVFQIAVGGGLWAVQHVNSGSVMDSTLGEPKSQAVVAEFLRLDKREV